MTSETSDLVQVAVEAPSMDPAITTPETVTDDSEAAKSEGLQEHKVFKMPMIAPRPGVRKTTGGLKNVLSEKESVKQSLPGPRTKPSIHSDDSKTSESGKTDLTTKTESAAKTDSKHGESRTKPKKHTFSPAELASQPPIPYKEPAWGSTTDKPYSFEVIKNGTVVDTVDLTKKAHYVFGRLPSCDITMEHPSLSRYHAVVQHCGEENEKHAIGWYLYDLDSTHGTWVNKIKLKPRVYHRLRVGHVIKFGGSSRLNILMVSSNLSYRKNIF